MSTIAVTRTHGMTLKKAKAAAEEIAAELAEEFDICYAWEGNVLHFERTGVEGSITVDRKHVTVQARLGLMLMLLRTRIEQEIHRFCDEQFGPAT